MLSEVPIIAPETVYLYQNTSVIPDEVLASRIGLIPLKINPDLLEWPTNTRGHCCNSWMLQNE